MTTPPGALPFPVPSSSRTRSLALPVEHRSGGRAARRVAALVASGCALVAVLAHLDVVDARPTLARPQRVARPRAAAVPTPTVATLAMHPVDAPAPVPSPAAQNLQAAASVPPTTPSTPSSSPVSSSQTVASSTGGAYAFLRTSSVGPARWDPCAGPIRYAVNLASSGDPAAARADVAEAFRRLAAATGLTFVDAGTSTWDGRDGNDPVTSRAEITIAWADARVYAPFGDGVAGWTTDHWTQSESGRLTMQRATVLLRREGAFGFAPASATGWGGLVLLHELGHAMGLEHVADPGQLMYEELDASSPADFAAGDRAGLARLGSAAGCNPRRG